MPEPALPIRLIALDIDGTLVDQDLVIGERTSRRSAKRVGGGSPFARHRPDGHERNAIREALCLTGPLVAQQGALIRAIPAPGSRAVGRLLYHRPLKPEVTIEIVRWCRERALVPHFNHLEWMVVASDEEPPGGIPPLRRRPPEDRAGHTGSGGAPGDQGRGDRRG